MKAKMRKYSTGFGDRFAPYGQSIAIWIPVCFIVFVFMLGGGARSDIASLPLLRGGSVLFALWAAFQLSQDDWRRIRVPLVLTLALTVWIALQLVPLPPSVWHHLPGREIVAQLDELLGQSDVWRPISMTPSQTWNALLAMTVVLAGLLVAASLKSDDLPRVMFSFVIIGCVSCVIGLFQALSGAGSSSYFYRITNDGAIVGLFANRNHHAIFLAWDVLIASILFRDELMRKRSRGMVRFGLAVAMILLTVVAVLIGSRAGLAAIVASFVVSYIVVASAWYSRTPRVGRSLSGRGAGVVSPRGIFLALPPIILALSVGIALALSSRVSSVTRIRGEVLADDMRILAWPTVEAMINKFWLLGSGFGSFAQVFKIYEPDSLLQPTYFNHAHNDFAEVIISGGIFFAILIACAVLWVSWKISRRGLRNLVRGYRGDTRLPAILIILIAVGASLVDYPLRVPSLQVFLIWVIVISCSPPPPRAVGPK
ncbi:MAG: O-antigen ligase family protein [Sphingopyxis terrae]|uniref:O-antigen ligase family protein n=1 Tax=Sphingopyxis terrae TaxID=33052 RepID=UPI003F7DD89D